MDDRELNQLLREWQAPGAPPHLRAPIPTRQPWWRWLMTGTIRVPVPVGLAAGALLVFGWMYSTAPQRPEISTQPSVNQAVVSLADFQPVQEAELRVVGDLR
jgi:hypothetical protein